jgi:hypothetical protein
MNTKQLIDQLIQRLNYYRKEHAIIEHVPSKYELKIRIEELEKRIENLRNLPLEQQNQLDNKDLEILFDSLPLELNEFEWQKFDTASKMVIINVTKIIGNNNLNIQGNVGSTINITQQTIEKQPIPRFLTKSPFMTKIFLGREDDLQNVHKQLFSGTNFLMLVNGKGGIGKTTFAAKYWQCYEEEYKHLAFLFVENGIAEGLLSLALPLGIQFNKETTTEQLEILLTTISNLKKPCLVVLDNANDLEDLNNNIIALKQHTNLHILMTSRLTECEEAETYPLDKLSEEKALELFKEHYSLIQENEHDLFLQIYEAVEGNTLLLELLAKNLNNFNNKLKKRYTLQNLVDDLQNGLTKLSQSKSINTGYQAKGTGLRNEKIEVIVLAMYDLVELNEDEITLLSMLSILPAENIEYETLEYLLKSQRS